jgi:hypothetical protein
MLGGILDFKLAAEDVLRASGVPAAVVRPCALTEEPRGMPLTFDQGDTIKVGFEGGREGKGREGPLTFDQGDTIKVGFEGGREGPLTFDSRYTIKVGEVR